MYFPKPGKSTYSSPRYFRPISLSSFLLKTLENLVDRDIRDRVLSTMPLHGAQHAYMAGKSIETVLNQLVYRLEGVLKQKELEWEECSWTLRGYLVKYPLSGHDGSNSRTRGGLHHSSMGRYIFGWENGRFKLFSESKGSRRVPTRGPFLTSTAP